MYYVVFAYIYRTNKKIARSSGGYRSAHIYWLLLQILHLSSSESLATSSFKLKNVVGFVSC
jgi:hypothetical protein